MLDTDTGTNTSGTQGCGSGIPLKFQKKKKGKGEEHSWAKNRMREGKVFYLQKDTKFGAAGREDEGQAIGDRTLANGHSRKGQTCKSLKQ